LDQQRPSPEEEKKVHDSVWKEEDYGIEDAPQSFERIRKGPGDDDVYDRHDGLIV
jgi:hypothetical protein